MTHVSFDSDPKQCTEWLNIVTPNQSLVSLGMAAYGTLLCLGGWIISHVQCVLAVAAEERKQTRSWVRSVKMVLSSSGDGACRSDRNEHKCTLQYLSSDAIVS